MNVVFRGGFGTTPYHIEITMYRTKIWYAKSIATIVPKFLVYYSMIWYDILPKKLNLRKSRKKNLKVNTR